MAHRITDRRCRSLGHAEQHELLARIARLDHCAEILYPACGRQVSDFPVAHARARLVVTDEPELLAQKLDPVPPDGTLEVVGEMREPGRRLDERRAMAERGPREPRSIASLEIADRLRHAARSRR